MWLLQEYQKICWRSRWVTQAQNYKCKVSFQLVGLYEIYFEKEKAISSAGKHACEWKDTENHISKYEGFLLNIWDVSLDKTSRDHRNILLLSSLHGFCTFWILTLKTWMISSPCIPIAWLDQFYKGWISWE